MCLLMRISSNPLRPSTHGHHQGQDVNGFVQSTIHSVSLPFHWPHHLNPILCLRPHFNNSNHAIHRFLCAPGHTVHGITDSQSNSAEPEGSGSTIKDSQQGGSLTITKILEQLKRYGVSGILSYGILNTVYYLSAFLLVWFYFAPVPGKMGYLAAVTRFLKVMAMVWAGSQVTKLIRAAGALALAPFVDRGLSWFTVRFKFESRGKAFFAVVGFCLGLAVILSLVVTLLWA